MIELLSLVVEDHQLMIRCRVYWGAGPSTMMYTSPGSWDDQAKRLPFFRPPELYEVAYVMHESFFIS